MPLSSKLLLIILDGVPWRNWRRLFGNLEGWVQSGEAQVWKMRSVLPSTSACCYASIHTGVSPQVHGIRSNAVNADRIRSGLLTDAMIASRSGARGVSEKEYMSGNLLGQEVTAQDVAQAFLHHALAERTTADVTTVDGGNIAAALR